jgi:hypothetical protein
MQDTKDYNSEDGEPIEERMCMACGVAGCECDEYDHSEGCEDVSR